MVTVVATKVVKEDGDMTRHLVAQITAIVGCSQEFPRKMTMIAYLVIVCQRALTQMANGGVSAVSYTHLDVYKRQALL